MPPRKIILHQPFILPCVHSASKNHSNYQSTCITYHHHLPTRFRWRSRAPIFFSCWQRVLTISTFFRQRLPTQSWIRIKWSVVKCLELVSSWYPTWEKIVRHIKDREEGKLCKLDRNLSREFVLRKVQSFKLFQVGQGWRDATTEKVAGEIEQMKCFEISEDLWNSSFKTIALLHRS